MNWVIVNDGSDPENLFGFECLRCGERHLLASSIELDTYIDVGRVD